MSEQSGNFDVTKTTQTPGPGDTLVTELVGEGKKFKSVEDLARGKVEADGFIEKLKNENKALRDALDTEGNPDDVLKRITDFLSSQSGTKNTGPTGGNQSTSKESLSKEEVLELLSERESVTRRRQNVDLYNAHVNKAFGDKASDVVSQRMQDLGIDGKTLQTLAETSPKAALQALGLTAESGTATGLTSGSSVNTEALFGEAGKGNGEKRNFAFYQEMRRKLGAAYYEPHVQKEVFESRKKLGDAFWK